METPEDEEKISFVANVERLMMTIFYPRIIGDDDIRKSCRFFDQNIRKYLGTMDGKEGRWIYQLKCNDETIQAG